MPLFQRVHVVLFKLRETLCFDGRAENARLMLGPHLRAHRRKGKDSPHAQFLGVTDELRTKCPTLGWRLRFADKYDQIVLLLRVLPQKQPTARQAPVDDQPLFHLDALEVEKLSRWKLGEQVHAQFCHQVVAGADGHGAHPRPSCDQPRIIEFKFFFHNSIVG